MLINTLRMGIQDIFGAKEHLKSLSNKKGDITVIGHEEIKLFSKDSLFQMGPTFMHHTY
jgi:hypothetical protein